MRKLFILPAILFLLVLIPIIHAGLGQENHGYNYDTIGTSFRSGVVINVTSNFTLINITKYSPSTADRIIISSVDSTGSNSSILQVGYFTGITANVSLNLTAGLKYMIEADNINDTSHTTAYSSITSGITATTFPITGNFLRWENSSWDGVQNGNGANIWNILSLTYRNNQLGANQTFYNSSTYQTARENILSNWTLDVAPSSATMYYNGTASTSTITNTQSNVYTFSNSLDIAANQGGAGSFYWNITYPNGTIVQSNPFFQLVENINLSLCSAANNVTYINITFKNETTAQERINASIPISTWYYWLGSGIINKTLTYSNAVETKEYDFCFDPPHRTLSSLLSLSYDNTESEQRTYSPSTLTLSNSTTQTTLFLLPSLQGQYVTFQVINTAQQALSGVNVVVSRSGIGTIETGTTDSSGTVTFFLNPSFSYTFVFSRADLTDFTTTITPSQTSYTITMGGSGSGTNNTNPSAGMSFVIMPIQKTLNNNTAYNFNLTLNSSYWTLDSWGYTLQNRSGFVFDSESSTSSNGGFLSSNLNTGLNSTITMNYFWVINGNYNNATVIWGVIDLSDNTFSISQFFTDFRSYFTLGFFGLDDVGLGLITFFAIFIITGVMSYKFGINSHAAIMAFIFSLTMFFDLGLGLVPNPIGAIPHAPTFFIGIIMVAMVFREIGR